MRQVIVLSVPLLVGCASVLTSAHDPVDGSPGNADRLAERPVRAEGAERIIIAPEVLDGWNFLYSFITEVEFVLCLEGREEDGAVVIDGFRLAHIEATNRTSVRYKPCVGDRYVGTAHNHPPTDNDGPLCYRSVPDQNSFERDTRALVDVVLCGPDRYLWVLRDGTSGGTGYELGQ